MHLKLYVLTASADLLSQLSQRVPVQLILPHIIFDKFWR